MSAVAQTGSECRSLNSWSSEKDEGCREQSQSMSMCSLYGHWLQERGDVQCVRPDHCSLLRTRQAQEPATTVLQTALKRQPFSSFSDGASRSVAVLHAIEIENQRH